MAATRTQIPAPMPGKEEFKETAKWLAWTLLGGLMPLWGTFFLLRLFAQEHSWGVYFENGEFALYAAALAAPACFQLFRELKCPFPARGWLGLITVFILAFSTLLFAGVVASSRVASQSHSTFHVNTGFLAWASVFAFLTALSLAFWITAVDLVRSSYDPRAVDDEQVDELAEQVRRVRKDN